MLLTILGGLVIFIGTLSGLLGIIAFMKPVMERKMTAFSVSFLCAGFVAAYIVNHEKNRAEVAVAAERSRAREQTEKDLQADANLVAGSIIQSGWESVGDYKAYLSLIEGFYARHSDRFPSEAAQLKKDLAEWSDDLRTYAHENRPIPNEVERALKGLVSGHVSRLYKIGAKD